MGLRGLYDEATAADDAALKKVLERYDGILQENPVNVVSNGKFSEAVSGRYANCVGSQC